MVFISRRACHADEDHEMWLRVFEKKNLASNFKFKVVCQSNIYNLAKQSVFWGIRLKASEKASKWTLTHGCATAFLVCLETTEEIWTKVFPQFGNEGESWWYMIPFPASIEFKAETSCLKHTDTSCTLFVAGQVNCVKTLVWSLEHRGWMLFALCRAVV